MFFIVKLQFPITLSPKSHLIPNDSYYIKHLVYSIIHHYISGRGLSVSHFTKKKYQSRSVFTGFGLTLIEVYGASVCIKKYRK